MPTILPGAARVLTAGDRRGAGRVGRAARSAVKHDIEGLVMGEE
jgi:hypothetical protein